MNWQPGEPIEPKKPLTTAAVMSRLDLTSVGYVSHVDRTHISFYMGRKGGWIEARCPIDVFAANFHKRQGGVNLGYVLNKHYPKNFPADFLR